VHIEKELKNNSEALIRSGKALSVFYNDEKSFGGLSGVIDLEWKQILNDLMAGSEHDNVEKTSSSSKNLDPIIEKVPSQVYLNYLTMRKEVLGRVNAFLSTQYEMAKMEEAKQNITFQVVDEPSLPIRKISPRLAPVGIGFSFGAFFLAFAIFAKLNWR
jgi:hypothetical protein